MSHVDDGLIHAWLDGALFPGDPKRAAFEEHLELCDECRARVEAERTIRARATDVLSSLAPDAVRVEPFEQMIARRRAERAAAEAGPAAQDDVPGRVDAAVPITTAPSRRRRRYVPLAWAASLLMAVTAGWFARAYLPAPPASLDSLAEQPQAESSLTGATEAQNAARAPEPAAPPATAPTSPRQALSQGAGGAVSRDEALGQVAARDEKSVGQSAKDEPERRLADSVAGAATMRPPSETRKLADAMIADEGVRAKSLAAAPAPVAFAAPGATDSVLAVARAASWERVTDEVVTERLGHAPLRIEGLPVDSLQATAYAGAWLVRVVQPLGSAGGTAEILQWPATIRLEEDVATAESAAGGRAAMADSTRERLARTRQEMGRADLLRTAASPAAPAAGSLLRAMQLERTGFRALLRASVSEDSLQALAARIR